MVLVGYKDVYQLKREKFGYDVGTQNPNYLFIDKTDFWRPLEFWTLHICKIQAFLFCQSLFEFQFIVLHYLLTVLLICFLLLYAHHILMFWCAEVEHSPFCCIALFFLFFLLIEKMTILLMATCFGGQFEKCAAS